MANVEEEEAWINEKLNLVASEDYGDTLAAVQVSPRHAWRLPRQPQPFTEPGTSSPGSAEEARSLRDGLHRAQRPGERRVQQRGGARQEGE